jgi:hypothetical protein
MFAYSDPTGTGALAATGALQNYREKVGFFDQRAAQDLARGNSSFWLQDPAGIRILELDPNAQWTLDGQAIDINNPATNQGIWTVSRNGRRGVFTLQGDVRVGGNKITTGTQLSHLLFVGADVIHAPDAVLPEWAQAGHESTRGPGV